MVSVSVIAWHTHTHTRNIVFCPSDRLTGRRWRWSTQKFFLVYLSFSFLFFFLRMTDTDTLERKRSIMNLRRGKLNSTKVYTRSLLSANLDSRYNVKDERGDVSTSAVLRKSLGPEFWKKNKYTRTRLYGPKINFNLKCKRQCPVTVRTRERTINSSKNNRNLVPVSNVPISSYSRTKDKFNFSLIPVSKQCATVGYGLLGFFTATRDV